MNVYGFFSAQSYPWRLNPQTKKQRKDIQNYQEKQEKNDCKTG
jgi:hypothetical protein